MAELTLYTYLDLCTQVYDLSKPIPPQDEYEFYRAYAISANGPILEPMCGTGRFLLPLIAEGFNVHGFDASKHMLDALYAKANAQNLKVNVWQAFIEEIKIPEKYQLIFIPSGTFNLILDIQQAKKALKKLYDSLTNDGILVFEAEMFRTASTRPGIWRGTAWTREDGKIVLANFLDLALQNNIGATICRYELIDDNTIIKTEIENFKLRFYDPDKLFAILSEVGFTEIKMIKAFDHSKQPESNDEVVVYECKKVVCAL